jgi:hypothetical protein
MARPLDHTRLQALFVPVAAGARHTRSTTKHPSLKGALLVARRLSIIKPRHNQLMNIHANF